jgi:hypothetical protein
MSVLSPPRESNHVCCLIEPGAESLYRLSYKPKCDLLDFLWLNCKVKRVALVFLTDGSRHEFSAQKSRALFGTRNSFHVYKVIPFYHVIIQTNPVHILTHYIFNTHFNIILCLGLVRGLFLLGCTTDVLYSLFISTTRATCPTHVYSLKWWAETWRTVLRDRCKSCLM